ncbi:MAG: hypothetical protein ABI399_13735 [Bauldia sp.]
MIDAIRFYGLGKLGLPLASLFASSGIRVFGIDTDAGHVETLQADGGRFDEPGLGVLLGLASGNLTFHSAAPKEPAQASIIHVPTPSSPDAPRFSSSIVEAAIESACKAALEDATPVWPHLIVVASTLMPGTFHERLLPLAARLSEGRDERFVLSYVPDLVAIGDVIRGFRRPPALIIGADDPGASVMTRALYARVVDRDVRHANVSLAEAELSKVAWNFFFCLKIDFANQLARLADGLGGINVDKVVECLALDARVGRGFLKAGMPFGGPCFPRDVRAMMALCGGEDSSLATAVAQGNEFAAGLRRRPGNRCQAPARRHSRAGLQAGHGRDNPVTIFRLDRRTCGARCRRGRLRPFARGDRRATT